MANKRTKGGPTAPSNTSTVALRYVLPRVKDLDLPNVEGMSPRAAFNAYMDHAKRILHPSVLHELLAPKLQDLVTNEPGLSMLEAMGRVREQCTGEQQFLRGHLKDLSNEVERYVRNNASHALIPERLGWMIGQVEAWEWERFHGDNAMDMPPDQRNAVTMERDRYFERWAGLSEEEKDGERMLGHALLKHTFATTNLRVEFGQRLEEIAAALNSGRVAATPARSAERLEWKSSTAAFAYIFNELAARGYFELPRKGGKEGDPNVTAFARALLQTFDLKGVTVEQLRQRLSDGAPGQLAETKRGKFQVPDKGALIVPNAEELR